MNHDRLTSLIGPVISRISRTMRAGQRQDLADLAAAPDPEDRVVLLGDSITRQGHWEELLPDLPVANRGIDADSTRGLLERLDDVPARPRAISRTI